MALEYFCCFNSYRKKTRNLSDSELGRLFRALMLYNETGEKTQLNGREETAFDFIAEDIDAGKERYEAKCAQNKANRGQRSTTAVNDGERTSTNANDGEQTLAFVPQTKNKNKIYLSYLTILKIYAKLKAWLRASSRLRFRQRRPSRTIRRTRNCGGCCLSGWTTARRNAPLKLRALSDRTLTSWQKWHLKAI